MITKQNTAVITMPYHKSVLIISMEQEKIRTTEIMKVKELLFFYFRNKNFKPYPLHLMIIKKRTYCWQ